MPPLLKSVDRILMRVDNITAAARFYTDTLGLKLDRQTGHAAALRFTGGETELVLHDDRQRPEVEVVLGVDDVQALYDRRDELGLTFLTTPKPSGRGHRATIRDPFGHVLSLADRGETPTRAAGAPAASAANGALFDDAPPADAAGDRAALITVYEKIGRTADDLPYTPHFERLHSLYARQFKQNKPDHAAVWRQLLTLRKAGKLPKLGVAVSKPPPLDPADKKRLRDLLGPDVGKRDRLPYTDRFDAIVAEFNKGFARAFSPHVVWRLVATLAK
ncbi:MAG TPA: VOC family protein [Tepidisphaeraceae bacterium]|jgi:catechol 2,3-dioxygenase-like lactoylglutathione lyase family enzyme